MIRTIQTIALAAVASVSLNAQAGDFSHSAPAASGYDVVTYQTEWLKDVPGRIATADANWTEIEDKDPASL